MKIVDLWKESDSSFKKHLLLFVVSYFFVLFNYSLIKASTTAFFFGDYPATAAPMAWLWGVGFLVISIGICNRLQTIVSVQKLFLLVSLFSSLLFTGAIIWHDLFKSLSFIGFVWKEIYIVIQVHLMLAYANNFFKKEQLKLVLGPIGAMGSIGGILGGILTSALSVVGGTTLVLWTGLVFILVPSLFFFFMPELLRPKELAEAHESPLSSLDTATLRKYVFYIAAMVALSQFIINIADFNFNLRFTENITDSGARTAYLGNIYSATNFLSLIMQFLLLPYVLPRVSEKNYHIFIPVSYFVCLLGIFWSGGVGLLPMAFLYVYFKTSDYSIFTAGKELLYQPLRPAQKYGAKYLTDMLMYRSSKALIAVVLIYLQTSTILNMLMIIFLTFWIVLVIQLFKLHRQLHP